MESIQGYREYFKGLLDRGIGEWLVPSILILVSFSSFLLGRLSAHEEVKPLISIQNAAVSEARPLILGGLVVASRSGNAYHFPWCPGAETMKESNKIWFKDESAARKAGYLPAKNCEGLK